jgi:hypothetical protein
MRTSKPKLTRTYVTAKDAITKETVNFTVYDVTPKQLQEAIDKASIKPAAKSKAQS